MKSKYIFYTTSSVRYLLLFEIQRERTCPRKKATIAIKNAKKCAGIKNISSLERKNSTEIQVPTPKNIERRALIVCTFLNIRAITSGTNAQARVILYALSTMANILASELVYLYATKSIIIIKNITTVPLVRMRAFLSDICRTFERIIFSIKSALGAKSVPEAVDMIAERRAPKNIICTKIGVFSSIKLGRIR
jgi:hypothetical protein